MQPEAPISETKCANCDSLLTGNYCGQCGQSARSSRRLNFRDVLTQCAEAVLDAEAAFPATLIGLCTEPGKLCSDYVSGKRKRYLNPFTYLLIAITAQVIISKMLSLAGWKTLHSNAEALPEEAMTWMLLLANLPLAIAWTWIFKKSGRNLAENYVLGLYITAQFVWIEALLLPLPPSNTLDIALLILFSIAWTAVVTWAGATFYSMPWPAVL